MVTTHAGRLAIHRGRHVPPSISPRWAVERVYLCEILGRVLDEDAPTRIVSIAAPAGSGKTVVLSRWCRAVERDGLMSVAWLTVDESDNDAEVLCAAVTAALAAAVDRSEFAALAESFTAEEGADAYASSALVGNLLHAAGRLCLIIDDAHMLHDATALDLLAGIVRWAPDTCRVVLAGRFEPPMLTTRARVAGTVIDITTNEMNFSADEARELLDHHGLTVSEDVLNAVMDKTAGWAAGVQLAALTAVRSDNPMDTLIRVGGADRAVADYLVDEFIASLPDSTKRILIATAIPDSVSASLAAHLTGTTNAHVILEALTHHNFLLTRSIVGGEATYSYHPMMQAYLRAESEHGDRTTSRDVRRRLALWLVQHHRPFEALTYAIQSADAATVETVVDASCVDLLLDARADSIVELLGGAPPTVKSRMTTRLVVALARLGGGHRASAAVTLAAFDSATASPSALERALASLLRAQLALRADMTEPDTLAAALDGLASAQTESVAIERAEIRATIALEETAVELCRGRLDHAERRLNEARDHAWAAQSPALEVKCCEAASTLHAYTGHFGAVVDDAVTAVGLVERHALEESEPVHVTQTLAAYAAALREEPGAPRKADARRWAALARSAVLTLAETARTIEELTRVGGPAQGHRLRPRYTPDRDPLAAHMRALLAPEVQHRFLRSGDRTDAIAYSVHVRHKLGDCAESAVLTAMVQRYDGRHAGAHQTLSSVLRERVAPVHPLTLLWAWLEEASMRADHDTARALDAMRNALEHAEPENLLRPFDYHREKVRSILDENRGRFGTSNDFAEVVRGAVKPQGGRSAVRLSPREMDLLQELPTFRTTDAIAAGQFVSVNTVKTHLRGIYRKLGVNNRRDAIAAAQTLGLI